MQGLAKLVSSKSAIVAVAVIAAATVLCGLGKLPWTDWKDVALVIGTAYVGGEKVRDAAAAWREGGKKTTPPAQP